MMQDCGLGLALLAASLPTASGLRLGVARRLSEPDGFSGDSDPSNLDPVGAELDLSAEGVSLPPSGLAFAVSAFPAASLGWAALLPTACGMVFLVA
jgi:hypothetical protein